MRVGELARRAGVTVRALRYYERAGLVVPRRLPNGYRDYGPIAVRQVREIRDLTRLGLSVLETRPFVDCLAAGGDTGDECPASLAAYRDAIDRLSDHIEALSRRRDALTAHLEAAARRAMPRARPARQSARTVFDEHGAAHLPGRPMPALTLTATDGAAVALDALGEGRTVLYVYPLSGRPGVDLPDGWDTIPGARGCTAQACDFRDHYQDLVDAGASRVYGLSSQSNDYQRELVNRLGLPFTMLSDPEVALRDSLRLPTFTAGGLILYQRLTMIVAEGAIEHVFHPVRAPERHAGEVLDWLRACPR